jgi:adenylate cyclase
MRAGSRRRLRIFLWIVVSSVVAGGAYGTLAGYVTPESEPIEGALIGMIRGFTLSFLLGGSEVYLPRTRVGRWLGRAPFLMMLGIKGLLYGLLILGVEAVSLGNRLIGIDVPPTVFGGTMAVMSIAFSFVAAFTALFMLQISALVGGHTLAAILRGRYHRPRVEARFFLFIDVAGSTGIAERLGPAAVHRFLNRIFRLAADPIEDHRGQIYQYVGDEIVVTWMVDRGRRDARSLACFFAIEAALERAAPTFLHDFGTVPRLRAALHAGPVIAGEVGESKREIVFHGDTMNTAARLEQLTRDLGRQFIVSSDALDLLAGRKGFRLEDLGEQAVRGRAATVRVFAVDGVKA